MKVITFIILSMLMISATIFLTLFIFLNKNTYVSKPDDCSFKVYVIDSTLEVYDKTTLIGTVKLEGELDSLMTDYLQ